MRSHHRQLLCDQNINRVSHIYRSFTFYLGLLEVDMKSALAYHCQTFATVLGVSGHLSQVNVI